MSTRERGFMPPCFHEADYDICTPCTGMCRRGLAGQHRVTHCTAQSSSGTLFGGTLYATARDTHIVPTPSLNYHDHTQHASFSCWLLDALVKSALPRSRVLDCSGTRWKATVLPAWGYGSAAPQQRFYVGPGVRHGPRRDNTVVPAAPPWWHATGGKGVYATMLS